MFKRVLELCRTGVHGQAGTVVTDQDIKEIVSTYVKDSAPVTIWPHNLADYAPSLGTVEKVWSEENPDTGNTSLIGTVVFNDLMSDAYDKKLYPTWSIGAPRRASDKKRYLHHLKMCGSEPAAVKGLKDLGLPIPIKLSDCPEEDCFELSDPHETQKAENIAKEGVFSDSPGSPPRDTGAADQIQKKERTMDPLQKLIDAMTDETEKAAAQKVYDDLKAKAKKTEKDEGTAPAASASSIEASDTPEDPKVAQLYARLKKDSKASLLKAAEGKVPKGMENDLIALADSLSIDDTIELSDTSGGKESVSAMELLTRILHKLPDAVAGEVIGLSDTDGNKKPSKAVPFSKA